MVWNIQKWQKKQKWNIFLEGEKKLLELPRNHVWGGGPATDGWTDGRTDRETDRQTSQRDIMSRIDSLRHKLLGIMNLDIISSLDTPQHTAHLTKTRCTVYTCFIPDTCVIAVSKAKQQHGISCRIFGWNSDIHQKFRPAVLLQFKVVYILSHFCASMVMKIGSDQNNTSTHLWTTCRKKDCGLETCIEEPLRWTSWSWSWTSSHSDKCPEFYTPVRVEWTHILEGKERF